MCFTVELAASLPKGFGLFMRLLIIEDDSQLAAALAARLVERGYRVEAAYSAGVGMERIRTRAYDMVLLDLAHGANYNDEFLREIRARGFTIPVLVVGTIASGYEPSRVLAAGADCYIAKPFDMAELLLKLNALHNAVSPEQRCALLELGDLTLDTQARIATRGGEVVKLTGREFDLLELLVLNRGTIISRNVIAQKVWDLPVCSSTLADAIDAQVCRLRRKIDALAAVKLIHTVRNVGVVAHHTESYARG